MFAEYVDDCLKSYGLYDKVGAFDIISWHQEYMEPGYDENTPEQLSKYLCPLMGYLWLFRDIAKLAYEKPEWTFI